MWTNISPVKQDNKDLSGQNIEGIERHNIPESEEDLTMVGRATAPAAESLSFLDVLCLQP